MIHFKKIFDDLKKNASTLTAIGASAATLVLSSCGSTQSNHYAGRQFDTPLRTDDFSRMREIPPPPPLSTARAPAGQWRQSSDSTFTTSTGDLAGRYNFSPKNLRKLEEYEQARALDAAKGEIRDRYRRSPNIFGGGERMIQGYGPGFMGSELLKAAQREIIREGRRAIRNAIDFD